MASIRIVFFFSIMQLFFHSETADSQKQTHAGSKDDKGEAETSSFL